MDKNTFVNLYYKYLTTERNISAVLAKPILLRTLVYSDSIDISNYLLSVWDDFGVSNLCYEISQLFIANNPDSFHNNIEQFKKDICYLQDFLHYAFTDYQQIPNLKFTEESLNNLLPGGNNNDDTLIKKVLELDPSMKFITDHIKTIAPSWPGEIQTLVIAAKDGNAYAVSRLCDIYMKAILKQSLYFTERYSLSIADVFQNGYEGFIKAIDKWLFGYNGGLKTAEPPVFISFMRHLTFG